MKIFDTFMRTIYKKQATLTTNMSREELDELESNFKEHGIHYKIESEERGVVNLTFDLSNKIVEKRAKIIENILHGLEQDQKCFHCPSRVR